MYNYYIATRNDTQYNEWDTEESTFIDVDHQIDIHVPGLTYNLRQLAASKRTFAHFRFLIAKISLHSL